MNKISRIDNFTADSKSKYGLEAGGTSYMINKDFYIEVLSSYDIEKIGEPNILKPVWSRIKLINGDIISVTSSGAFLELKDFEGFLECRPESSSKEGEPSFDRFIKENISKIGKDMISSNPMTLEERKKLITSRI
jgi:hypothetical protein